MYTFFPVFALERLEIECKYPMDRPQHGASSEHTQIVFSEIKHLNLFKEKTLKSVLKSVFSHRNRSILH